jgi:predicted ATPase
MIWEFRLLGAFQTRHGEAHINSEALVNSETLVTRFRTQRAAALLAYLAYFPRAHPREVLVDVIWPDAPLDKGQARLRQELSALRHLLEPPGEAGSLFLTDRRTVQLRPGAFVTDVAQFEKAFQSGEYTDALTLYKGPLLRDFYDDWTIGERRRLEELHEEAQRRIKNGSTGKDTKRKEEQKEKNTHVSFRGRVPQALDRFFGREREIDWILDLLNEKEMRLITLIGPGGAGKTRLAQEAARRFEQEQATEDSPRSVYYVPLADVHQREGTLERILTELELPRPTHQEISEHLIANIATCGAMLLVLDNVESLLESEGMGEFIQELVQATPNVICLVTSRQPLEINGERQLAVLSLDVPPMSLIESPEQLYLFSSVRLFVDRAQSVRPEFALTARNASAVATLCRSLEGIPLALEIFAQQSNVLTPEQMLLQLQARLDAMGATHRGRPARHRTLRATIESSYCLLSPQMASFLRHLIIFRGGWTWEAAQAVTQMPSLEPLNLLRRHSLLTTQEVHGEIRWGMLQMVADFVRETLDLAGESECEARHAEYYLSFVEQDAAHPHEIILTEMENVRAAMRFFLEAQDAEKALRLCLALEDFWKLRGYLREGRKALERALQGDAPRNLLATGCRLAGVLARRAGEMEISKQYHNRALDFYRQENDAEGVATTLSNLGVLFRVQGEFMTARHYQEESLLLRREIGSPRELASTLNNLGVLLCFCDDTDRAYACHRESLSLCESNAVPGMHSGVAAAQINLGWTELARKNYDAAYQWFLDGIGSCNAYGNRSGTVEGIEGIGATMLQGGEARTAALLWSITARERERSGEPLAPYDAKEQAARLQTARQVLGDTTFEEAWQEGVSLDLEAALALAREKR